MKKTVLTIFGAVALSCALFSQQALADSVSFAGGTATASGASPGSPTVTVSFSSGWSVFAGTGIFAGTATAPATINAYTFSGDGAAVTCTTCPETQWSFVSGSNTYSFTLTSLTSMHTTSGAIGGTGLGYVQVNGGAHLAGSWSISGTSNSNNFTYDTNFTFISTTTVPDGGSAVALLGVALTGVEGLRRVLRRRSA